jgi:glycerol dehydrogenase-like iron-containing ADH family enzyme
MSYCRFSNTLHDFRDCYDELDGTMSFNDMNLSEEETIAMNRLAIMARRYLERYTELQEQAEYEFARTMDDGA